MPPPPLFVTLALPTPLEGEVGPCDIGVPAAKQRFNFSWRKEKEKSGIADYDFKHRGKVSLLLTGKFSFYFFYPIYGILFFKPFIFYSHPMIRLDTHLGAHCNVSYPMPFFSRNLT